MEGETTKRALPGDLARVSCPDESRRRFFRLAGLGTLCFAAASSQARAAAAQPTSPPVPPRTGADPSKHERYMRRAIALAKEAPQFPFGAVIVQRATGVIVAEGHNRSAESPTFHGEIVVINRCAADHASIDWTVLDLYTTAEPCAMCQSAVEWAGIPSVGRGYACCFAIPSSALPRRGLGTRALHQRSGRQAEVREDLGNHGGMFDACPEPLEGAAMICKVLPLLKGTGHGTLDRAKHRRDRPENVKQMEFRR